MSDSPRGSVTRPDTITYVELAPPPASPAPVRERIWLHLLLLVLTLLAATIVGADHYYSFLTDYNTKRVIVRSYYAFLPTGLWFSLTVLAILGAHEMGHYLACRYHRVSASLPYFIPAPFTLAGTFGAFIRIRQPIYRKRALFDIGIAGPIAGFLVALPALFWGLSLSRVTRVPVSMAGVELGEPLLFQWVAHLLFGAVPDGYSLNLHPMGLGAWFGLLATLLNLFPIGQLDGGHISYAVFGRHARRISLGTVLAAVALTFVSMSWILWTVLAVAMLFAFGLQHPQVIDESEPLDTTRRWLALAALVIFILCFTPAPIQPLDLLHR